MAMIDYGALVFKNGMLVNENEFFMDMKESVGWVDIEPIRVPDCSCLIDVLGHGDMRSDCKNCPRAQYVKHEVDGKLRKYINADCMGRKLYETPLNENYFAYVGDKKLTLAFYKTTCTIVVDGKVIETIWGTNKNNTTHRVLHLNYAGVDIKINRFVPGNVLHASLAYNGDFYHIIYGYGIDSNLKTWNKIKVQYLGKRSAKGVDKLIKKLQVA